MSAEPIKTIVEVLRKHPEGLALIEIARLIKMNRMTVAKYVHGLVIANKVKIKKIGAVKLCYLKKNFVGGFHGKK